MRNINPQVLHSQSLLAPSLESLIPKDHPKRVILDKLAWDELCKIAKSAYKSWYWQDKPNPRIMIGLFVWSCLQDKTYREIADDYTFNRLCAYTCGFKTDDFKREIDHTTLIKFEEHLGLENILKIKDIIESIAVASQPPNSKGRHSADSTVIESEITYPTDTKLIEIVRKFLVNQIIKVYQKQVNQSHRHYGRIAKAEYLKFAKKRTHSKREIKATKKKQLQFLKRNLDQAQQVITALKQKIKSNDLQLNTKKDQKAFKKVKAKLLIARLIYWQQLELYQGRKITNRIVSFHRPSIRPIFRGKAHKRTEFGLKTELSLMGKALILGKTSFDNFYDGKGLQETIIELLHKAYSVKEVIGDKGNQGCSRFLEDLNIIDGLEKRGKRNHGKDPPIPKKRFVAKRNQMEGAIGILKKVLIKIRFRAKTDFGDFKKICKACLGYNLIYAL